MLILKCICERSTSKTAFYKETLSAAYNMKKKNEKHYNRNYSKTTFKLVHKYLGQRK